jgi:DNA-binding transcriptional LysR family regulator
MAEIRQLRYLLAVVEHGSVSRAAIELHLSQSALSEALRKLEVELGVELLSRGGRGVAPTAAGEALVAAAREAMVNAAKHSGADAVQVDVVATPTTLRAVVTDDGRGGADPSGGGLAGLARRVAASDGTLSVSSPPGGPTVIRAELPCG